MPQIGIFFGSTDGHTAAVAEAIKARLDAYLAADQPPGASHSESVEVLDVGEYALEAMLDFDWLILGAPTWNTGQLPRDWETALDEFDTLELAGRPVALFGLGDQVGYPDTFADALIFLADRVRACGGHLVGAWPATGYSFTNSWAVEDGCFVGLVLDEVNQPELTAPRLDRWLAQLWQRWKEDFT